MAFVGAHIVFSSVATKFGSTSLPSEAVASQTIAAPGTSTISAPGTNTSLLSISASSPIFYATGATPDPSGAGTYPRRYMDPAFGREDVFVQPGDYFAYVFAGSSTGGTGGGTGTAGTFDFSSAANSSLIAAIAA